MCFYCSQFTREYGHQRRLQHQGFPLGRRRALPDGAAARQGARGHHGGALAQQHAPLCAGGGSERRRLVGVRGVLDGAAATGRGCGTLPTLPTLPNPRPSPPSPIQYTVPLCPAPKPARPAPAARASCPVARPATAPPARTRVSRTRPVPGTSCGGTAAR